MQEVNKTDAFAGSRLGDYLFPRSTHGQLIGRRQQSIITKLVKVLRLDGRLDPVAVNLLQHVDAGGINNGGDARRRTSSLLARCRNGGSRARRRSDFLCARL